MAICVQRDHRFRSLDKNKAGYQCRMPMACPLGKCPDMIVDGKYFYEHKGYTTSNPDKSAINMINKALKQSSRIIIEEPLDSKHDVRKIIEGEIRNGKKIDEVYIVHKNEIELVYKKNESNW